MRKTLLGLLAGVSVLACSGALQAARAESRGYVLNYMAPAMYNVSEDDCPKGMNIDGPQLLERILRDMGKSEEEIKAGIDPDTFDMYKMGQLATFRGRIDGKPVDAFLHPLSTNEPMKFLEGNIGVGFNLDGKDNAEDFTDPLTGETGVDNEMSRILGCTTIYRGTPDSLAKSTESGPGGRRGGLAWLLTVDGADNLQNAENVTVTIQRARQLVSVGAAGPQRNVTYTTDTTDPRQNNNVFHGRIKDGVFVSDKPIHFFMVVEAGYDDIKQTRLRINFMPDGSLRAFMGGFHPIKSIYAKRTQLRGIGEQTGNSYPALYQALVKLADTDIDKDPKTGMRTRISATYQFGGVPAFVRTEKKPTS